MFEMKGSLNLGNKCWSVHFTHDGKMGFENGIGEMHEFMVKREDTIYKNVVAV